MTKPFLFWSLLLMKVVLLGSPLAAFAVDKSQPKPPAKAQPAKAKAPSLQNKRDLAPSLKLIRSDKTEYLLTPAEEAEPNTFFLLSKTLGAQRLEKKLNAAEYEELLSEAQYIAHSLRRDLAKSKVRCQSSNGQLTLGKQLFKVCPQHLKLSGMLEQFHAKLELYFRASTKL